MESPVVNVERTLCLIKPDIIEKADEVLHIIRKSGFYVVQVRLLCACVYRLSWILKNS